MPWITWFDFRPAGTAGGSSSPSEALDLLEAMRWLDRIGYHTGRICHYLAGEEAKG